MIKNENNMYVDAHNHLDFYGENIGEAISDIMIIRLLL